MHILPEEYKLFFKVCYAETINLFFGKDKKLAEIVLRMVPLTASLTFWPLHTILIFLFIISFHTGANVFKNNKEKKDALASKLESLLETYKDTAGMIDSYSTFFYGVLNAIKESGIISKGEIYEFTNANYVTHELERKCAEMIKNLKYPY